MSGDLPKGWVLAKVKEAGNVQLGRQRSPKYHSGENMRPYLRVANVFEDRIDINDVMEMDFTESDFETFRLNPGDILLNEGQSRELVGRPAMFRGEVENCCFTNSLVRFRAGPATSNEFSLRLFLHYLKSGDFMAVSKWTTNIAHLGAGRFAEMDFPLPPLNEQKRIVAKIDALTEKSREARQALDEVPALLDKLRQSILAAAFRGDLTNKWREQSPDVEPATVLLDRIRQERRNKWEEAELAKFQAKGKVPKDDKWKSKYKEPSPVDAEGLPELPEGWCWAAAELACDVVVDCHNKTAPYSNSGIPLIRTTNIRGGRIDLGDTKFVTQGVYEKWSRRCPPLPGDVIFTREAPMGEAGMVPEKTTLCMGQRMMLLRPNLSVLAGNYLLLAVQGHHVQTYADKVAVGTGVKHLRVKDVERLPIPVAPLTEQGEVLHKLAAALDSYKLMMAALLDWEGTLSFLDSSILAKAFRGELVPQDPSDEPAAVLLERIRKEREASAPKRKTGRKRT